MDQESSAAKDVAILPSLSPPILAGSHRREVRCAVRFPLALPVVIYDEGQEYAAMTKNISASGVLFALDRDVPVGKNLKFSLCMPGQVLGIQHDVLVHCTGRVVRCYLSEDLHLAAATIDEYEFMTQ